MESDTGCHQSIREKEDLNMDTIITYLDNIFSAIYEAVSSDK